MSKLTPEQIANALNDTPDKMVDLDEVNLDVSLEELDSFGDKKSIKEMYDSVGDYNKMLDEKITFINKALTAAVPFTRENLYLMCAYSGHGKSTIAANISYALWKEEKKTLVIWVMVLM